MRIEVSDLEASVAFYEAALAPLGARRADGSGDTVVFAVEEGGRPPSFFLISKRGRPVVSGAHIAFAAADGEAVDAFHAAALAAGADDNGGPGIRSDYGPDYYAAFVLDPDGNNIEAVVHGAP